MADEMKLRKWVAEGESETQEFKTQTSTGCLRTGGAALCAFLNTRGGRVFFGVEPDGTVSGQEVSDKTLRDVAGEIKRIDPPAFPEIEGIRLSDGSGVIAVTTDPGSQTPYTYRDKPYRRVGSTTVELSREEYNEMLLARLQSIELWENQPVEGWSLDDLDEAEIVRTIDAGVASGRLSDPGTRDLTELLRGLGLTKDGELLRAAVVLFGRSKRMLPTFPQCRVRLARFKGIDKTEFLDNRQFEGNAFELLLTAEAFLRQHLPIAGKIVPDLFERQDDPIYPPVALREALANAFCHRDYSVPGGSVGVAIFDDRLEISSTGKLHFGLTAADLYEPHESLPWNPLIASVFHKRGFIESWGRGTIKMTQLTEEAGLPRPEFEETPGALIVRFRPSQYLPPHRVGRDLSDQQRLILSALAERGELSLSRVHELVDPAASKRSIQGDLHFLRTVGLVSNRGHARGARWFLQGSQ